MSRWTAPEDALIIKTANLTAAEVAELLGRSARAVDHRRSKLGRERGITFLGSKVPTHVGRRRLLAKTCADCGLLLEAARFGMNQGKWRSRCVHCRADDEALRRPKHESSEADTVRASENIRRLQALTIPAVNHRQPWLEKDHEVLANPDLTGLEKALRLDRTYMATVSACSKFGYRSKVGKGDPIKGQWVIDNPNAPEAVAA